MSLETVWFVLIAVLWAGYFVLEGFDFGVGIQLPFIARNEDERDEMLETIEPVWDGNEVWLVVAGGATFAAFPHWYATGFSGLYLALLLVLVFLILRVVSFEWGSKAGDPRWRATWHWANTVSSIGAPFIWGVGLANFLHGMPLNGKGAYTGNFLDLFSAYTVAMGVAVVLLFAWHGATFLSRRAKGDLRERAAASARRLAIPVALVVAAVLVWTVGVAHTRNERGLLGPGLVAVAAIVALAGAAVTARARRADMAFLLTALGAVGFVATLFTSLYPRVLVSHPDFANSLTVSSAASEHYTLKVITFTAIVFVPVVIAYQAWTYRVLRRRLEDVPQPRRPAPTDAFGRPPSPSTGD